MDFKTWNEEVDWENWDVTQEKNTYIFELKSNKKRKAIFTFGKNWILVFQLIFNSRVAGTTICDKTTLSHFLKDWEVGNIYMPLRL